MSRFAEAVGGWVRNILRRRSAVVQRDTVHVPNGASGPVDMPLGRDAAGASYVLNFETGAIDVVRSARPALDRGHDTVHPLEEVTPDLLVMICRHGGFMACRDDEGDVHVRTNIGNVVITPTRPSTDMMRMFCCFPFTGTATMRDHAKLVRRLNRNAVMTRYYAPDGTRLMAEYDFLLTAGLSSAHFLSTLRVFADITQSQMYSCGAHKLVA
jgi:hypothetical protein